MNWFGRFILTIFISFCCMIGALGAKYPVSILLVLLAKGGWLLFVIAFFWNRDKIEKPIYLTPYRQFYNASIINDLNQI